MKSIKSLIPKAIISLAILVYAAVIYVTELGCVILRFTGIRCLGCGMTRALLSVLRFDFSAAFSYHFMFWSLPFLYLYFLKDGKLFKNSKINKTFLIIILVGFVFNWGYHQIFG